MEDSNTQATTTSNPRLSLEERAEAIVEGPMFSSFGTDESEQNLIEFKAMYFNFVLMHLRAAVEEALDGE